VIEQLHPVIGEKILHSWAFPTDLMNVPRDHNNFARQTKEADYADLVTIALLQSYMGVDHPYGKIDYNTVTAFERLGLDPDMQSAEAEDLSEDMAAAMQMLQG